jgi:MFS family permease
LEENQPKSWPVRYNIGALLFTGSLIAWADRVNLSVAVPAIMAEFGWDMATTGFALSAFTWGLLLFLTSAGWLADKLGGFSCITAASFLWSLLTLLTAVTGHPFTLFLLRVLLGMSEAFYTPGQAVVAAKWFPKMEMPRVIALCNSGSALGPLIATPLASWLLAAFGWRSIFYVFAALGFLWWLMALWYGTDDPKGHRSITMRELAHIEAGREATTTGAKLSWRLVLRSSSFWGLVLGNFANFYCFWLFFTWLPTYLADARGFSTIQTGFYAACPFLVSFLFTNGAGWISSLLIKRGRSVTFSRNSILFCNSVVAALLMLLAADVSFPLLALAYISLAVGMIGANIAILVTLCVDLSPDQPAILIGATGSIGYVGGILAPIVTGLLVDATGRWELVFYLASALALANAFSSILLIAAVPIGEKARR